MLGVSSLRVKNKMRKIRIIRPHVFTIRPADSAIYAVACKHGMHRAEKQAQSPNMQTYAQVSRAVKSCARYALAYTVTHGVRRFPAVRTFK